MPRDTRRLTLWLSLFLVALLALAGCAAPASQPQAGPAQEQAAEPPAEVAADACLADGTVVVGTNAEYRPFEFVDENGNIVGFDIDLMDALAQRAGFDVQYVNTKWDGIFVALANGEFEAVISAVTITPERAQVVDFSDPYFNAGQAIAVRADDNRIQGPDDLDENIVVGVQLGTTGDIWVTDNTNASVQRFEETPLAIQALANGDVDAVVVDAPTLADYIRANPELNLKIVGEPFTDELYGIAVRKDCPSLLQAINNALAQVRQDGTYDQIFDQWFGVQ